MFENFTKLNLSDDHIFVIAKIISETDIQLITFSFIQELCKIVVEEMKYNHSFSVLHLSIFMRMALFNVENYIHESAKQYWMSIYNQYSVKIDFIRYTERYNQLIRELHEIEDEKVSIIQFTHYMHHKHILDVVKERIKEVEIMIQTLISDIDTFSEQSVRLRENVLNVNTNTDKLDDANKELVSEFINKIL